MADGENEKEIGTLPLNVEDWASFAEYNFKRYEEYVNSETARKVLDIFLFKADKGGTVHDIDEERLPEFVMALTIGIESIKGSRKKV